MFDDLPNFPATNAPWIAANLATIGRMISPGDPRHLQVDLRELWLPVLASILVPEALGDLIVFINRAGADE